MPIPTIARYLVEDGIPTRGTLVDFCNRCGGSWWRSVLRIRGLKGSEDDAREFLATAHPLLGGRTPLDVALTELGARRVEELLWKLFYGVPA